MASFWEIMKQNNQYENACIVVGMSTFHILSEFSLEMSDEDSFDVSHERMFYDTPSY